MKNKANTFIPLLLCKAMAFSYLTVKKNFIGQRIFTFVFHQNLRSEQYGFVKEENTNITMVDFITALNEKYSIFVVIFRFVEAFELMIHKILFELLYTLGIC